MKTYEIYQVRRWILADTTITHLEARAALIAIEVLDWTTKSKTFKGKPHYNNWLKATAIENGLEAQDIQDGLNVLGRKGYATCNGDSKGQYLLTLAGDDA